MPAAGSASQFAPDLDRRFGGLDRLYGAGAAQHLQQHLHVVVVGVGGVGSWAVEGLARCGVGELTLVDMDHVAESNINRQLQALSNTLGQAKIQALADRIAQQNPTCGVNLVDDFVTPDNAGEVLQAARARGKNLWVLDCCDQLKAKEALVLQGRALKVPVLVAGSAGGKQQGWKVQPADLRDTIQDPLLAKLRQRLRKLHGYPAAGQKMGVQVFYSPEPVRRSDTCDTAAGLNCAGFGSMVGVTAVMGLQMANSVVNQVLAQALKPSF